MGMRGEQKGGKGAQESSVPCSVPPFSDRPEGADALVALCAWRAPQAPTSPLHSREGDWSCHPTF